MVQVRMLGIALDAAQQHVILLKPVGEPAGSGAVLPVWIGAQEATAILVAVEGVAPPRPLAHDLMKRMLEALDARVERVEVTRVDGGTYFAEITLGTRQGRRILDARPSDAIALASRTGTQMWVADDVMEEAGVPDDAWQEEGDAREPARAEPAEADEDKLDAFRRFLEEVEPDDFERG